MSGSPIGVPPFRAALQGELGDRSGTAKKVQVSLLSLMLLSGGCQLIDIIPLFWLPQSIVVQHLEGQRRGAIAALSNVLQERVYLTRYVRFALGLQLIAREEPARRRADLDTLLTILIRAPQRPGGVLSAAKTA